MKTIVIVIPVDGDEVSMLETEELNYEEIGEVKDIRRASHVEWRPSVGWEADMSPSGGPVLGPFRRRSEALAAEEKWLIENNKI